MFSSAIVAAFCILTPDNRFLIKSVYQANSRPEVLPVRVNRRSAIATHTRSTVVPGGLQLPRCSGSLLGLTPRLAVLGDGTETPSEPARQASTNLLTLRRNRSSAPRQDRLSTSITEQLSPQKVWRTSAYSDLGLSFPLRPPRMQQRRRSLPAII